MSLDVFELAGLERTLEKAAYVALAVAAVILGLAALAAFALIPGARLMAGLATAGAVAYAGKRAGLEDKYAAGLALAVLAVSTASAYTGALTIAP